MKTIIDIDERNRIELDDFGDKLNMAIYFRMDNLDWVIHGGALLTKEKAASFGICLIEKAGKDKEMLKVKFQRKER
jgi:hypothetical protein